MPLEALNIATLCICSFTLVLASAALMPQLKKAFLLMRDLTLASFLVLALSLAGFFVWSRVLDSGSLGALNQFKSGGADSRPQFEISELFPVRRAQDSELDPLPLPSIEDDIVDRPSIN